MRMFGILAASAALALCAPAMAVQYRFVVFDPTLTQNGGAFGDDSYTFFFDSSPTPVTSTPFSFSLTGSVFYSTGAFGADGDFSFQTGNSGFDTPLNSYFSDQLFTGDTSAPTFKLGTFLTDVGSITISTAGSTPGGTAGRVPEPAAWTTMIAGFGLVGATLRGRRTRISFAA